MALAVEVLGTGRVIRPDPGAGCDYAIPGSIAELRDWCRPILQDRLPFGADWETTSLNPWIARPVGLGLSFAPDSGRYVPVGHLVGSGDNLPLGEVLQVLKDADAAGAKSIWFNAGYDHEVMETAFHWTPQAWHDAIFGVFLVDSNVFELGLKPSALRFLGKRMQELKELDHEWVKLSKAQQKLHPHKLPHDLPPDLVCPYGCADSDLTRQLWFHKDIVKACTQQRLVLQIEEALSPGMREGIRHGVYLDPVQLDALYDEATSQINALEPAIMAHFGETFALSRKGYLADKLHALIPGVIKERTDGGALTANVKVLEGYKTAHPVIPLLIRYAKLLAQRDGSVVKLRKAHAHFASQPWAQGRVRFAFNHIGVPTGRMKCGGGGRGKEAYDKGVADVNAQAIPEWAKAPDLPNVRTGFIAPPGYVVVAIDYSQVEIRIAGNVAPEPVWVRAYLNDEDIHLTNAQVIANVREPGVVVEPDDKTRRGAAKTTSFALLYGGDERTVARNAGVALDAAKAILGAFFAGLPGIAAWVMQTKAMAESQKQVATFMGRIRRMHAYFKPEPPKPPRSERYTGPIQPDGTQAPSREWARWIAWVKLRNAGYRESINHPIQGGAADIFKMACIFLKRARDQKIASGEWPAEAVSPVVLWIHDEVMVYVRRDWVTRVTPELQRTMEFPVKGWAIPLKTDAEVGSRHLWLQSLRAKAVKAKDDAMVAQLDAQLATLPEDPTGRMSTWGELVPYATWVAAYGERSDHGASA